MTSQGFIVAWAWCQWWSLGLTWRGWAWGGPAPDVFSDLATYRTH